MQRTRLDRDIKPLSEFRANAARMVEQLKKNKRPMVLTQRGHSAAVLLDVSEYEKMVEELELLREIAAAEKQLDSDGGIPHEDAKRQLRAKLGQ